MKRIAFILMTAILLVGGAVAVMPTPSYAQGYEYPTPPPDTYMSPWVGPDTPWVYYNGDWFLNGTLYYFFGPRYGWAPYYAYSPGYIIRPNTWYAPRWLAWYRGHPQYWESFQYQYPYWREHRHSQRYGREFYEQHHHGQGGGWHTGFQQQPQQRQQMQREQRQPQQYQQMQGGPQPPQQHMQQMQGGQQPPQQPMQGGQPQP